MMTATGEGRGLDGSTRAQRGSAGRAIVNGEVAMRQSEALLPATLLRSWPIGILWHFQKSVHYMDIDFAKLAMTKRFRDCPDNHEAKGAPQRERGSVICDDSVELHGPIAELSSPCQAVLAQLAAYTSPAHHRVDHKSRVRNMVTEADLVRLKKVGTQYADIKIFGEPGLRRITWHPERGCDTLGCVGRAKVSIACRDDSTPQRREHRPVSIGCSTKLGRRFHTLSIARRGNYAAQPAGNGAQPRATAHLTRRSTSKPTQSRQISRKRRNGLGT